MADVGSCDQKIVLLTVEEAKKAHKCVMIEIANLINAFGPPDLIRELEALCESMRVKIEQAEKCSKES